LIAPAYKLSAARNILERAFSASPEPAPGRILMLRCGIGTHDPGMPDCDGVVVTYIFFDGHGDAPL